MKIQLEFLSNKLKVCMTWEARSPAHQLRRGRGRKRHLRLAVGREPRPRHSRVRPAPPQSPHFQDTRGYCGCTGELCPGRGREQRRAAGATGREDVTEASHCLRSLLPALGSNQPHGPSERKPAGPVKLVEDEQHAGVSCHDSPARQWQRERGHSGPSGHLARSSS